MRSTRCLMLAVALVAAVLTGCAGSPPGGTGGELPAVDLGFEKYTLANGLDVILRRDSRVPVASVNLLYRVGPANEGPGRTGFAHLFEHMMFQGSGHVAKGAHVARLEAAGGSSINATTQFDRTVYTEDVPANALELALWLESDRMGFLLERLDQTALSTQQSVVRNERRENHDTAPYALSNEAVYRLLFPENHPYHANIIGSHTDIQAARLDDVRDFFRRYYVPNNASLAIVGDIDVAATKTLVERYFGSIPRGPDVPAPQVVTPRPEQEKRLTVTDQVELPAVTMAWLTPPVYAPGDAEADMTARLLAGGRTSRLSEALVRRTGLAQSVTASQQSRHHGSVFTIDAVARPGHSADELEAAIGKELDALAADGPTAEELAAARTGDQAGTLFGLERSAGVADLLNSYNHSLGDPGFLNRDLRRFADVQARDVTRFVAEQLPRDRRVVIHTVPGAKVLPPEPPETPVSLVETAGPPPPSTQPWRAVAPVPGPAAVASLPAAKRFELANGLPVYLVEAHHLPLTTASLVSRWGNSAAPADRPGVAGFMASLLDEGTQGRNAMEIARGVDALGAYLAPGISDDGSWVSMSALTPRMREALGVMADVVREPSFPAAEVERVRGERLVALQQQRDDVAAVAEKVMWRGVYGDDHPYGKVSLGTEESLRAISREDLERFHRSAFTPRSTALVLTGDLTEARARELAEEAFGDWTGDGPPPPPLGPPVPAAERVLVVDRPGAPQTSLLLAQPGVTRRDPDFEKLQVMNQILGGGFTSRVNLNLRERHGYTYGASSDVTAARGVGPIRLRASVQTRFTGAAVHEMLGEVAAIRDNPVSPEELELAKQSLALSLPAAFVTVGDSASTASWLYLYDMPPDYFQGQPARIARITAADVQAAARAHLRPEEMKVIAVGDRQRIDPLLAQLSLGPTGYRTADGSPVTR